MLKTLMSKWPRMSWKATEIENNVLKPCSVYNMAEGVYVHCYGYVHSKNWGGRGSVLIWELIFSLAKIANLLELLMSSLRCIECRNRKTKFTDLDVFFIPSFLEVYRVDMCFQDRSVSISLVTNGTFYWLKENHIT